MRRTIRSWWKRVCWRTRWLVCMTIGHDVGRHGNGWDRECARCWLIIDDDVL